jgi:hypothetical protein
MPSVEAMADLNSYCDRKGILNPLTGEKQPQMQILPPVY